VVRVLGVIAFTDLPDGEKAGPGLRSHDADDADDEGEGDLR
jgi:hypothetical protein